jgi:hypothetical protein
MATEEMLTWLTKSGASIEGNEKDGFILHYQSNQSKNGLSEIVILDSITYDDAVFESYNYLR